MPCYVGVHQIGASSVLLRSEDLVPVSVESWTLQQYTIVLDSGPRSRQWKADHTSLSFVDETRGAARTGWERLQADCGGGNGQSCYDLGVMWDNGNGGPADLAQAKQWVGAACKAGHKEACEFLPQMRTGQ